MTNMTEADKQLLQNTKEDLLLQTPGIFVYNDAMFSDDDWKGIISIYNSVKEKEPLKVGRFGLGFKSVFHMTGMLCFI